jgi:hypothetical protein
MPHVTIYKPDGEMLLSTDVKRVEHSEGGLVLFLEGEEAEAYGPKVTTNLPYFIGSKDQGYAIPILSGIEGLQHGVLV